MPSTFLQEVRRRNILKVAAAYAVAGWLLLQVADVTFPAFGLDDRDIAYVLVALSIGLPMVVAFSWFYEITPDGLVPTRRVAPNQSISQETGRRINRIIIGLMSVALTFFMFEYFSRDDAPAVNHQVTEPAQQEVIEEMPEPPAAEANPSIAVMPFVNMSSDQENEYFSDGLSEELLNVLAQIKGLQVAGRTSSFYYKGRNEDLREIGRELNVNNILEGSVRKAGNKVRITAQLISAHDGFHLWSDTYDRELTDVFGIQEEISRKVAQALQLTLLADEVRLPESRQTENSEAHDAFLQARQLLYDRRPESILRSIDLFRLATQLDPEYAPPWVGLASANMIAWNNHRSIDLTTAMDTASQAYATVEQLGYLSSDYWASRGLYYDHLVYLDPDNYERSKDAFEKALELNPNNADVLHWYAITLRDHEPIAKLERERELISRAIAVDPHNRVIKMNYYMSMMGTPDEERGIEALKRMAREDPGFDGYLNYLAGIYFSRSRFAEAAEVVSQMNANNPLKYNMLMQMGMIFGGPEMTVELAATIPEDNPAHEAARLARLSLSGDRQELVREARMLMNGPDLEQHAGILVHGLMKVGEYQLLTDLLVHASPVLEREPPTDIGARFLDEYLSAAYLAGHVEKAKALAAHLQENLADRPRIGMPRARGELFAYVAMVNDDPDAALDELEATYEEGWLLLRMHDLDFNPLFEPLWERERFRRLVERIDSDLEKQRPRVFAALSDEPVFARRVESETVALSR